MSRDPLAEPPVDDGDIVGWTTALGVAGLVDVHVHFLPDRVMTKVWAFFDRAAQEYGADFAAAVPEALRTATCYPEPGVAGYLEQALEGGARCVKVHVQVGGFDPRDPVLDPVWGLLAEAGVPVVVHCGHGPYPGRYTGLDVFGEVLAAHPQLVAVLAHAGMPD